MEYGFIYRRSTHPPEFAAYAGARPVDRRQIKMNVVGQIHRTGFIDRRPVGGDSINELGRPLRRGAKDGSHGRAVIRR